MTRPDTTPLSITPHALKTVVQLCQYAKAEGYGEACGYVLGMEGVASKVIAVRNIHPDPKHNFQMHEQGVLDAMALADEQDLDVLCVYHSHPASAAMPSETDRGTPDHGPAYLIVSLEDETHPSCRAWRFDLEFVGVPRETEVLLHISDDGEPFAAKPPIVPWALTPGNKVMLTYQRPGHANRRTITCEITGLNVDASERISLTLNPRQGTDPKSMLIERIKAVRVLRESPAAGRVRQRSTTFGRALAHSLDTDAFTDAANYAAYLGAAYPTWLAHVEGE